jgi:hypothetical protein
VDDYAAIVPVLSLLITEANVDAIVNALLTALRCSER